MGSVVISAEPCPTQLGPGGAGFKPRSDLRQGASLSKPHFPHLWNGNDSIARAGLLWMVGNNGAWHRAGPEGSGLNAVASHSGAPRSQHPVPPTCTPLPRKWVLLLLRNRAFPCSLPPGALDSAAVGGLCGSSVGLPDPDLGAPGVQGAAFGEPVPRIKGWYCW